MSQDQRKNIPEISDAVASFFDWVNNLPYQYDGEQWVYYVDGQKIPEKNIIDYWTLNVHMPLLENKYGFK